MSRGFVKEEDQEEAPFIPPRASLPVGMKNYVTPAGLEELQREREELEREQVNLKIENDKERRHARAVLEGRLNLLNERLTSARVLYPIDQPGGEIRFGARVELRNLSNNALQKFQIVGVDEADVKKQKIAFIAPIARAVTGKKKGEVVEFSLGKEVRKLEILNISYQ